MAATKTLPIGGLLGLKAHLDELWEEYLQLLDQYDQAQQTISRQMGAVRLDLSNFVFHGLLVAGVLRIGPGELPEQESNSLWTGPLR